MGNNIFYKQTTMTQIIVAPGKTVVKDAAGNVMIKDNLKWSASASGCAFGICADIKTADNALPCDSEGNCMLKDKLANNSLTCDSEGNCMLKDKLLSFGGSYKGNSVSVSTADNALTCDSEGNCMLKDNLGGVSVGIGKAKVGVKWDDNAIPCDSEGNCMLKDNLGFFKKATKSVTKGVTGAANSAANAVSSDTGIAIVNVVGGTILPVATTYAIGVPIKVGVSAADNALTCDSEGNCMLKDNLAVGPHH